MKIKQLELENFRGFAGKHVVKFHAEKPTVIVGVNGSGKTSVLDAVGILLGLEFEYQGLLKKNEIISLQKSDISKTSEDTSLVLFYENVHTNVETEFKTEVIFSFFRGRKSTSFTHGLAFEITKQLFKNKENLIPIALYHRTNRSILGQIIKSYSVDITISNNERLKAYKNIFKEGIELAEVIGWYIQQINIQNALKVEKKDIYYEVPSIKKLTEGVNKFLGLLNSNILNNFGIQHSTYEKGQVLTIQKGKQYLEFNQLSAGERMLIGLALDIAYRVTTANPQAENALLSPGIVLIDELELHLHPKWQATVLNALHQTFPNIQFIVTTHSPLVINHVQSDQLVLINNDKIVQGEDIQEVYGKDVNSITENIMGAPKRPKDVEKMIEEIRSYLTDDNMQIEKAKEKLSQLQEKIGKNDGDVIELDTMILLEEDETY
jgi:predicted ATP-binding protein involved in virulence